MVFDKAEYKVEIYPNVNEQPVAPSPSKAGNGSHLISKFNALIDILESKLIDQQSQIDSLIASAGGKSSWIAIDSGYSAQFNDSVLILPSTGLSIMLPENPLVGTYVEFLKIDEETVVSLDLSSNQKINNSFGWDTIKLTSFKKRSILIWTDNINKGWLPIDENDFLFIGQLA